MKEFAEVRISRQAVNASLTADTKEGVIRAMVQTLLDVGKIQALRGNSLASKRCITMN